MVSQRSTIIVSLDSLSWQWWELECVLCGTIRNKRRFFPPPGTLSNTHSSFSSNNNLKGFHILQGVARIRKVTNLALIGDDPEDSKIQCEGPAGLYFKQTIQCNLTISNLMFSNCGWPTLWCSYPKHCVWSEPDQWNCRKQHWLCITGI